MPRRCKFCLAKNRSDLEKRIVAGQLTQTDVAAMLSSSKSSVTRHMWDHLSPAVREELKRDSDRKRALNVIGQVAESYQIVQDILASLRNSNFDTLDEINTTLKAVAINLKVIELQAKLTGQLPCPKGNEGGRKRINVFTDPFMLGLRTLIEKYIEPARRLEFSQELMELGPDD